MQSVPVMGRRMTEGSPEAFEEEAEALGSCPQGKEKKWEQEPPHTP